MSDDRTVRRRVAGVLRQWTCALALALALAPGGAAAEVPETPQFRSIGVGDGLPSSTVAALAQDHAGYLWIGTRDGLARYDGIGYRIWRHVPGDPRSLPGNSVQALYVDAQDRLWVAVESAGLAVFDARRGSFRRISQANRPILQSDDIWSIVGTPDGALWLGSYGGGLYRLDARERITRFKPSSARGDALPAADVPALVVDARGTLWVGTTDGLARRTATGFAREAKGLLPDEQIYSLSAERDGSLWIGTNGGLVHRLAGGRIDTPAWAAGLPDPVVMASMTDAGGTRWFGTRRGLASVRDGRVDALPSAPGASRSIFATMEDREGGLWFGTQANGLLRLPPAWRDFAVFGRDVGG